VSKYAVELWNNGQLVADLSGRANGRSITQSRNEADEITWSINLDEFERYCRLMNLDPKTLIIVNSTEVRIRRGRKYLAGGQITYSDTYLTANAQTISIRATGYLNLFKYRFTDTERIFTETDGGQIASDLITEAQAGENRDFGVTIGSIATTGNHDRTYKRTNVKDALQNLTNVQTNPLDFEFTPDKVFNTYKQLGSQRADIVFEYPRNITSGRFPVDGTEMGNQIIVLGSGFGELATAQVTVDDLGSQGNYKVRQKIVVSNSKEDIDELTQDGKIELAKWANPFQVPAIDVDGNLSPYVSDYGIGDYVRVVVTGYSWLSHINALHRLEKRVIKVDEDDNENVTLHFSR
jgi:hypothetical protein